MSSVVEGFGYGFCYAASSLVAFGAVAIGDCNSVALARKGTPVLKGKRACELANCQLLFVSCRLFMRHLPALADARHRCMQQDAFRLWPGTCGSTCLSPWG